MRKGEPSQEAPPVDRHEKAKNQLQQVEAHIAKVTGEIASLEERYASNFLGSAKGTVGLRCFIGRQGSFATKNQEFGEP